MNSAPPNPDSSPPRIPDHELIRRIGWGSYGEVWLARNVLGAYRAIKIVYRKTFVNQRPFERELLGIERFEPLSRSHEGFIDILQVGRNLTDGYFYYVMELGDDVNGAAVIEPQTYEPKTLGTEMARRGRLPFDECLQMGLSLSKALQHLHKNGLVHRDVKPANIIFVNGIPKLADIGLVAPIDNPHSFVGTIGFIPPEGPGTAQADIYSLGKVLYEISTGKDRQEFPELPTQLNEMDESENFLELNEILLKACQNAVGRRYLSAQEMHADLVVLENGNSIKRLRFLEAKFKRLKRISATAGVVVIVLAAIAFHIARERKFAAIELQQKKSFEISYATERLNQGDFSGALPAIVNAMALDPDSRQEIKNHRLTVAHILERTPVLVQIWPGKDDARVCQFHPYLPLLATATWGNRARIFDLNSMEMVTPSFGQKFSIDSLDFSPDGKLIALGSQDGHAQIADAKTGGFQIGFSHPDPNVLSVAFSRDGLRLLTGCKDGKGRIWDVKTGVCLLTLNGHPTNLNHAAFSHDGSRIATAGEDGTIRLWDASNGTCLRVSRKVLGWAYRAEFSPDDSLIAAAFGEKTCRVLDAVTLKEVLPPLRHNAGIRTAVFSPDGLRIATASFDSTVAIWDSHTGQPARANFVIRHCAPVSDVCFSPNGERIATACTDGNVLLWDLTPGAAAFASVQNKPDALGKRMIIAPGDPNPAAIHSLEAAQPIPREMIRSRNGRFLITLVSPSGSANKRLKIYDAVTGDPLPGELAVSNSLDQITLSDDGSKVALRLNRGVTVTELASGMVLFSAVVSTQKVDRATLNHDGSRLLAVSNRRLSAWNVETGRLLFSLPPQECEISDTLFSPDGSMFVCCCRDDNLDPRAAHLFRSTDGTPVCPPLQHSDGVISASFSNDGKRIVTAGEDFLAIIWETRTGRQITPQLKHSDKVFEASFNSDGTWVLTVCADGTARIWETATGAPLTAPLLFPGPLFHGMFLSDTQIAVWNGRYVQRKTWVKSFQMENRSITELTTLASLLSGNQNTPAPQRKSLADLWKSYRSTNTRLQSTSEQRERWHRQEADAARVLDDQNALAFHAKYLPKENPPARP